LHCTYFQTIHRLKFSHFKTQRIQSQNVPHSFKFLLIIYAFGDRDASLRSNAKMSADCTKNHLLNDEFRVYDFKIYERIHQPNTVYLDHNYWKDIRFSQAILIIGNQISPKYYTQIHQNPVTLWEHLGINIWNCIPVILLQKLSE